MVKLEEMLKAEDTLVQALESALKKALEDKLKPFSYLLDEGKVDEYKKEVLALSWDSVEGVVRSAIQAPIVNSLTFGKRYLGGDATLDRADLAVVTATINAMSDTSKEKFYEMQGEMISALASFVIETDKADLAALSTKANSLLGAKDSISSALKDTTKKNALLVGSLFNSRLSVYGMAKQATTIKVTRLTINSQLDSRRCPVCGTMHGKSFETSTILAQAESVLTGTEATAKELSPFIPASKTSTSLLSRMTESNLVASNYIAPPYHPLCRCVVDLEENVTDLPSLETKQPIQPKAIQDTRIMNKAVKSILDGKDSTPYLKPVSSKLVDKVSSSIWEELGLKPTESVTKATGEILSDLSTHVKLHTIENSFLEPEPKVSVYGSGIYATTVENVAESENSVSYTTGFLKDDANVITLDEILSLAKKEVANSKRRTAYALAKLDPTSKDYLEVEAKAKAYQDLILSDLGKYAMYLGYDVITIGLSGDLLITNPTVVKPISHIYEVK